ALPQFGHPNASRRIVVVTQGADPVIVADAEHGIRQFVVPKIASHEIVDTNGAGDGFCGGFLAGILSGLAVEECVEKALFVARAVLMQQGASYPREKPTVLLAK
ncbi:hypothetical protein HDU98_000646, partial [Podochytrium sp. JEL0797]